jgi:DNA recombination protein RmuC
MGRNLELATGAYNAMVGSFESQVFTQARRFESLGAASGKEMPPLPIVEAHPRALIKSVVGSADNGTDDSSTEENKSA